MRNCFNLWTFVVTFTGIHDLPNTEPPRFMGCSRMERTETWGLLMLGQDEQRPSHSSGAC